MFKFLKEKLKKVISGISKKVEQEMPKEEAVKAGVPEKKETIQKKEIKDKEVEDKEQEIFSGKKEKKGFFGKLKESITTVRINEEKFNDIFWDLEKVLLENNVATEVVDKIKEDLSVYLVNQPIERGKVEKKIEEGLRSSIKDVLNVPKINLLEFVKNIRKDNRPIVLLIIGYNGSGKSLSVARLARYFKDHKLKVMLAAGDTFRAGSILQLEEYGRKVDAPVIKHQMKSDSCSVIFDTINAAKSRNYDVVIADTAGRIHSNRDLMDELKKIVKVNKPDLKILVLDALSGSDVVEQIKQFNDAVGVDALIFTKVDVYEKGGSVLSGTYFLRKPVLFFGVGQEMDSFKEYNPEEVLTNLGF